MDIQEVKKTIKEVVENTANIPAAELTDDTNLKDDLELDSLTLLEIALGVDQAFDLDLPEEELGKMTTVQVSAELVIEALAKKATP